MQVRLCSDTQEWNALVQGGLLEPGAQFLQSWEWGAMQAAYGRDVQRYVVEAGGNAILAVQFILYPLARGKRYLFAPRGPVVFTQQADLLAQAHLALMQHEELRAYMKQNNVVFVRVEPTNKLYAEVAGGKPVKDVTPADSIYVELATSDSNADTDTDIDTDALLAKMKQKTRYNIRLGAKKGVTTREYTTASSEQEWEQATEAFIKLVEATASRHGIRPHPSAYYRNMISQLRQEGFLTLAESWHEEDLLSSNMYIHFGDTSTYLHGASADTKKNLMAPYGLQWQAIQQAKAAGKQYYDFYGVAPEGVNDHKLAGVTRFKAGFGGKRISYPGTIEFPISAVWYMIYRTLKRLRSK